MKKQQVRHSLTRLGELAGHPAAFGIIAVYAVVWLIFSPATFGWSAIASLVIWFMTLLITRTEHRDTEAIQAKLDELLRTHGEARDELTAIDEKEVEEITAHRVQERENDALNTGKTRQVNQLSLRKL
jgi:low affinity Fe/Cu permease